jgi:hypothetical protein
MDGITGMITSHLDEIVLPSDGVCIAGIGGRRVPVCIFASVGWILAVAFTN